jgi:hypothetical protein
MKELNQILTNNPSILYIFLLIILVILWLIIKNYTSAYSTKLGNIDAKIESLSKVVDIEEAITKAVKAVDHSYWKVQQIDQIRREKLEQILLLITKELQEIHIGFKGMKSIDDYYKISIFSGHVGVLTSLYFPEVINSLSKYERLKREYFELLEKNQEDNSNALNILIESSINLSGDLRELGNGLTFHN